MWSMNGVSGVSSHVTRLSCTSHLSGLRKGHVKDQTFPVTKTKRQDEKSLNNWSVRRELEMNIDSRYGPAWTEKRPHTRGPSLEGRFFSSSNYVRFRVWWTEKGVTGDLPTREGWIRVPYPRILSLRECPSVEGKTFDEYFWSPQTS